MNRLFTFILSFFIIPLGTYQGIALLARFTGNFEILFWAIGMAYFLCTIATYTSISHDVARNILLSSSFSINIMGLILVESHIDNKVQLFSILLTIVSIGLISRSKSFGLKLKNSAIMLIGLFMVTSGQLLFCEILKMPRFIFYWLSWFYVALLINGIRLILRSFGLQITKYSDYGEKGS